MLTLQNIDLMLEVTRDMKFDQFLADDRTRAWGVERCLLIISEAARKLGSEAARRCTQIPCYPARGLGNGLQHDYDRMNHPAIWDTITEDLATLRAAYARQLKP